MLAEEAPLRPPPAPPTLSLAIENARAPSPPAALLAEKASSRWSSAIPFIFIEQAAQLIDLFAGGLFASEHMHHELARRAFEDPLQDIARQLAFGLLCGQACCIDMRTLRFVSLNQTFCGHDLKEFQDAGVTDIFSFGQRFMDFSHRGRATRPQDAKDFELGGSRLLRGRLLHDKAQYYEGIRSVNENVRRL